MYAVALCAAYLRVSPDARIVPSCFHGIPNISPWRTVCCMRAWVVDKPGPMASGPLRLVERPVPEPGPGELLVRVICCGVCRTDLHLAEGDLAPQAPGVTPGHEVVGEVVTTGPGAARF